MQKYNFCRKSAPGAQPGSPTPFFNYIVAALAILAALAKLFLLSGCAQLAPGSPGAAMAKNYPEWSMTIEDEREYNAFLKTIPEAQTSQHDPNEYPDWCIDQFTGKRIECPVITFGSNDEIIITYPQK